MAVAIDAPSAASARLSGDRSLRVFRALLDAAARPGTIVEACIDDVPPLLAAVLALADLDQRVAVLGEFEGDAAGFDLRWSELISSVTGARIVEPAEADMVIARSGLTDEVVRSLRTASAFDPERGARLFIACEIKGSPGVSTDTWVGLTATGPGAPTGSSVEIRGVDPSVFEVLNEQNTRPPAGIDTWLIDPSGRHVGLPRTARVSIAHTAGAAGTSAEQRQEGI